MGKEHHENTQGDRELNIIEKYWEAIKHWEYVVFHAEIGIYSSAQILEKSDEEILKLLDEIIDYRFNDFGKSFIKVMELEEQKGKKVMEVGGGCGSDAVIMAQNGAIITEVDVIPTNLALTAKNLSLRNLYCQTIYVPFLKYLDLQPNIFDVIYSFGCIHHIPNGKKIIKHLSKFLKKDGIILLMLYHDCLKGIDYNEGHTDYYNCDTAKELLGDGFEMVECRRFHKREKYYLKVKGRKIDEM